MYEQRTPPRRRRQSGRRVTAPVGRAIMSFRRGVTHVACIGGQHVLPIYFDPVRGRVTVCCDAFLARKELGSLGENFRDKFARTFIPKLDSSHNRDYVFSSTEGSVGGVRGKILSLAMSLDALCDFMVFFLADACSENHAMAQLRKVIQVNIALGGIVTLLQSAAFIEKRAIWADGALVMLVFIRVLPDCD